MGRLPQGDAVFWFDIPKEAKFDPDDRVCANVPAPEHWVVDDVHWEPYGEKVGMKKPVIPDLLGEPLDTVLKRLDELDAPLCVFVTWNEGCEREPGTLCDDERAPDNHGRLRLTFAGRQPR